MSNDLPASTPIPVAACINCGRELFVNDQAYNNGSSPDASPVTVTKEMMRRQLICQPCRAQRPGPVRNWFDISPEDAQGIELPRPDIRGPLTMDGRACPWPWEPQQLVGAPMGQYHCGYCGEMCVAGVPHPDYRETD